MYCVFIISIYSVFKYNIALPLCPPHLCIRYSAMGPVPVLEHVKTLHPACMGRSLVVAQRHECIRTSIHENRTGAIRQVTVRIY